MVWVIFEMDVSCVFHLPAYTFEWFYSFRFKLPLDVEGRRDKRFQPWNYPKLVIWAMYDAFSRIGTSF